MDYKKKYEEAVLRMNKWVEGSEIIDPKEVAEYIFPELKESEDEKIRKEIIYYLDREITLSNFGGDIATFKKWIVWLEKQGEHANFRNQIQIGDEVTRNEDGALVNISQFKRMAKQGEQKLNTVFDIEIPFGANDSELQEVSYHIPEGFHAKIESNKVVIKRGEQSHAWSEEDEKTLSTVIKEGDLKPSEIQWLKSLKERI